MKPLLLLLLTALSASSGPYDDAMRALARKDYGAALTYLEAELRIEPDNVRDASEYRQVVIQQARSLHPKEGKPADFDRSLSFFERLVAEHSASAYAYLNYGLAYVDKIPAAGSITQVILANTALGYFSKSLELQHTWVGYYTRGNSYLFWPKIFNRAALGVADLEEAMKMQKAGPLKPYHVRAYISLGDGYWKTDNLEKARAIWKEGLALFPGNTALQDRMAKSGDELASYIEDSLDPNKRVDTNLKDVWSNP